MACTSCVTNDSSVVDTSCHLQLKCNATFDSEVSSCIETPEVGSYTTAWLITETGMPFATEDCKVLTVDTQYEL